MKRIAPPTPRLRGRKAVAVRRRRMARSDGLCEWCTERGYTVFATVVDHIVPLALGGADEDRNTRNLCDACHAEATADQFGHRMPGGVGADGRPTSPNHPWNRAKG